MYIVLQFIGHLFVHEIIGRNSCAIIRESLTQKLVRNNERLVGLQERGIRNASIVSRVVIEFVPTKIPTPTKFVVAYETLIANTVQWRVRGGDSYHCVCTSLPRAPIKFPYVHALGVPYLPTYAICTLCDRVSMKRQLVVLLRRNTKIKCIEEKII